MYCLAVEVVPGYEKVQPSIFSVTNEHIPASGNQIPSLATCFVKVLGYILHLYGEILNIKNIQTNMFSMAIQT